MTKKLCTGNRIPYDPPRLSKPRERRLSEALAMIGTQLDALNARVAAMIPQEPTPAEMLAKELKDPANRNLIASVNTDGSIGSVCLAPVTNDYAPDVVVPVGRYDHLQVQQPIPMSDARRVELEQRLGALLLIVDDKRSSPAARKRAEIGAASLRKLLKTAG
jgi:hypothetical protein